MIVDELINMVSEKYHKVYREKREQPKLCVYMDYELWLEMMSEIRGNVSSAALDLYNNKGAEIMGYPIYKIVNFPTHGVRVLEVE